jgi:hypothetical protein
METFRMFPNPASSVMQIYLDEGMDRISIYDLSGKMMFNATELNATRQEEVDLESLDDGIYLLQVQTGKRILTRKFIKH